MKPEISVVVITYNHEMYLSQAVNSVLSQTQCPDFEIIIGNDCSTDKTKVILDDYMVRYPDMIYVIHHETNVGMQKNLKCCLEKCRGRYIAFCEGDDYWIDRLKLKKQFEIFQRNNNIVMCFTDIYLYFENRRIKTHFHNKKRMLPSNITSKEMILFNGPSATFSCCMYRKDIIDLIPESYYEDYSNFDLLFNLYILEHGTGIFIKEDCVVYRIRKQGLWSGKNHDDLVISSITGFCTYNKIFNYKYSEYISHVIRNIASSNITRFEKPCNNEIQGRKLLSLNIPIPTKRQINITITGRKR